MKIMTAADIRSISQQIGLSALLRQTTDTLAEDFRNFSQWPGPLPSVLPAANGEIALSPWSDGEYFSVKYEAHRPDNVHRGRPNRTSLGCFGLVETGEILLLTDMTLLTAFRTAALAALGARLLANPNSETLGILGTGAQSEFLILALLNELPLQTVKYFDPDLHAMMKFARNVEEHVSCLEPCGSIEDALQGPEVILTATSSPEKLRLLRAAGVPDGIHVHALADHDVAASGLDPDLLSNCYLVSERPWEGGQVDAELRDLLANPPDPALRQGRTTLFVATGIGLQDFSVQRTLLRLATEMGTGLELPIMAIPDDPKDLYGCLVKATKDQPGITVTEQTAGS